MSTSKTLYFNWKPELTNRFIRFYWKNVQKSKMELIQINLKFRSYIYFPIKNDRELSKISEMEWHKWIRIDFICWYWFFLLLDVTFIFHASDTSHCGMGDYCFCFCLVLFFDSSMRWVPSRPFAKYRFQPHFWPRLTMIDGRAHAPRLSPIFDVVAVRIANSRDDLIKKCKPQKWSNNANIGFRGRHVYEATFCACDWRRITSCPLTAIMIKYMSFIALSV